MAKTTEIDSQHAPPTEFAVLPPAQLLPLHLLPCACPARVAQLVGSPEDVRRLEELGLRPGVVVELISAVSPCIVRLEGSRLCFRQSEVLGVLVTMEDAA